MKDALIQIAMAGIGTLGFSIYFRVREKNVVASTFAGIIGWAVYLLVFHFTSKLFFANFVASFVVYIFSEIMARILKAPSNIYLIPGIIPLLPGGALYYMMHNIVEGNWQGILSEGEKTASITFGIAAGILAGTVIFTYISKEKEKKKVKTLTEK